MSRDAPELTSEGVQQGKVHLLTACCNTMLRLGICYCFYMMIPTFVPLPLTSPVEPSDETFHLNMQCLFWITGDVTSRLNVHLQEGMLRKGTVRRRRGPNWNRLGDVYQGVEVQAQGIARQCDHRCGTTIIQHRDLFSKHVFLIPLQQIAPRMCSKSGPKYTVHRRSTRNA